MNRMLLRLSGAAAAAFAALAPLSASADTYEFDWSYKWSIGHIRHDTSVFDSDPSPTRAVYENAVLDYEFDGFVELNYNGFSGSGGSIIVDAQKPPGCEGWGPACQRTITFELGHARPDDPANYTLVSWFEPEGPGQVSNQRLDQPWVAGLAGFIRNETTGATVPLMSSYFPTTHRAVAAPVPEPATLALMALGFGGVVAGSRRRLQARHHPA